MPVLAQYTARSKQKYIFRSNRILEIVGASANIAKLFDVLFAAAEEIGIRAEAIDLNTSPRPFSLEETEKRFACGELQMIELTRGGGNSTVMLDSHETFCRLNRIFTFTVLKEYPGLLPMCVCVEMSGNYDKDYEELNWFAGKEKNRMSPGLIEHAVPFARIDRTSYQPITVYWDKKYLTAENAAKRKAGLRDDKTTYETKLLDDLVLMRGVESLLAVVHADGNNMGVKISKKLGDNKTSYDHSITALRKFHYDINQAFVSCGVKALEKELASLKEQYGEKMRKSAFFVRQIVADGDDFTFICNARLALPLTRAYLKAVSAFRSEDDPEERYSSCAGICIFHSHYPFYRAYDLAEQACESAKEPVHKASDDPNAVPLEECWLDFHYIHNGVSGDLEEIREKQRTDSRMLRPWLAAGADENEKALEKLYQLAELLQEHHVTRSNIKALGSAWELSREQGKFELERICYRAPKLRTDLEQLFEHEDTMLKAMYDLYEIYDLWFAGWRKERK